MKRLAIVFVFWAGTVLAQGQFTVLDAEMRETRAGVEVTFALDGITPYRVFTLDAPSRMVLDIEGLDLASMPDGDLAVAERAALSRAGPLRPGWSRLIFDLFVPMNVTSAAMRQQDDAVMLMIALTDVGADDFTAAAGPPPDPGWDAATGFDPAQARRLEASTDYVVVLDAAHGGRESGVVVGGIREADLALIMAEELAVRLNAIDGVSAVLSRKGNVFVPDIARIEVARSFGADLFLSFHADETAQRGLSVATYAPTAAALDAHDHDIPLIAPSPGDVGQVLGDLARAETLPAAERVADAIVAGFARTGVPLHRDARVGSDLPILVDATFPAVVVLLGGLGHDGTRAFLASPDGRNLVAATIADTVRLLAR